MSAPRAPTPEEHNYRASSPPRTPSPTGSDGRSWGSQTLVSSIPSTPNSIKSFTTASQKSISPLSLSRLTFCGSTASHGVDADLSPTRIVFAQANDYDESQVLRSAHLAGPEAHSIQKEDIEVVLFTTEDGDRRLAVPRLSGGMIPGIYDDFTSSLNQPGLAWVDKSFALELYATGRMAHKCSLPVIHRPPGFGKTAYLQMLLTYLEAKSESLFNEAFDQTPVGSSSTTESRRRFFTLRFDLSEMYCDTPEQYETDLCAHIDTQLQHFIECYHRELGVDLARGIPPDLFDEQGFLEPSIAIGEWLNWSTTPQLFIAVDNYDYPQRFFQNHPLVQDALERRFIDQLYSLQTFSTRGIMMGTTGNTPSPLPVRDVLHIWGPFAKDCSAYPEVATAMGFTEREIRELCTVLDVVDYVPEILSRVEKCYFSPDVEEGVYSMAEVLELLRRKTGPNISA